jgi:hypothetical protein
MFEEWLLWPFVGLIVLAIVILGGRVPSRCDKCSYFYGNRCDRCYIEEK